MNPRLLQVRFWGVRGSIPTPSTGQAQVGGNTPCIEVALDNQRPVIIDAGTGLRALGLDLLQRNGRAGGEASVLLSHLHWDHIQGIPFFAPMYEMDWAVAFHAVRPQDELSQVVRTQTSQPYFSAESAIRAKLSYEQIHHDGMEAGGMTIRPFRLNHPGGAVGFRMEAEGHSLVYASDHEHGEAQVDHVIRDEARGADLLIWDSQFTPEDYDSHKGWGHTTWLEGTRVAADADVKQLILFHHDPQRSDEEVKRIEEDARREFENTLAAREGLVISLPG